MVLLLAVVMLLSVLMPAMTTLAGAAVTQQDIDKQAQRPEGGQGGG